MLYLKHQIGISGLFFLYLLLSTALDYGEESNSMEALDVINTMWPIAVGFVTLVIVLAKMHGDIETIKEKVKVLFELWNKKD